MKAACNDRGVVRVTHRPRNLVAKSTQLTN